MAHRVFAVVPHGYWDQQEVDAAMTIDWEASRKRILGTLMNKSVMTPAGTKSNQAYEYLRNSIISADIEPDTPLRIQSLGKETGFGSTPVREALRRLEAEQLVVSAVNCGFRSPPISIEQLRDLEKSRLVIESSLLAESIQLGDDAWESGIIAAHYQLSKMVLPTDTEDAEQQNQWYQKHEAFHDALLAAANSYWLASFRRQISEQLERHYHCTVGEHLRQRSQQNTRVKDVLRQVLGLGHHTMLMDATVQRKTDLAIDLLNEHIHFASDSFSEVFG